MKRTALAIVAVVALLGIAATGLLAAGCGSSSDVPSDAVATVGDASVTKADFQELLTQAKTQVKASGTTFPAEGTSEYDQYAAQIVDYLVQEQIVAQSAGDLGVSVTDKEVTDQIAQIKKAYGGEKKVLALLAQQGMTMDLLKRSLRSQALTQKVATAVVKKATVSDADIQAYWDAHQAQLSKKKATATLAKATATIRATLLESAKQQVWKSWIIERTKALGVEYADGYDPAQLRASSSASPSASANSGG
jgi:peptidyl-prolyl cis-trans isomerase SurA